MSSKEKTMKKQIILIILIVGLIILFISMQRFEKKTYAYETQENQEIPTVAKVEDDIQVSNSKVIDLDSIIQKNSETTKYREEITVEEEELEYITKYRNNPNIYIGKTEIAQEGRNGVQAITTKRTYDKDGKLIKEEQVSAVVVKASINKVIDIGTKKHEEPKVQLGSTSGALSFNVALNRPSGFTLEQFIKALTDTKDKNKIFQNNAKYFYYAEKQYSINGMFVAAVGIHESAWGTSKIARNKNNLFGYGAYDSNPYNGAYTFENYAESIDLISRVFVKYYLNPKGTTIYDGQVANGKYYSGNTLSAVNKKYASDKNWANGVYTHMQYLYNKLIKWKKFGIILAIFLIILYDIRVKKCNNDRK